MMFKNLIKFKAESTAASFNPRDTQRSAQTMGRLRLPQLLCVLAAVVVAGAAVELGSTAHPAEWCVGDGGGGGMESNHIFVLLPCKDLRPLLDCVSGSCRPCGAVELSYKRRIGRVVSVTPWALNTVKIEMSRVFVSAAMRNGFVLKSWLRWS